MIYNVFLCRRKYGGWFSSNMYSSFDDPREYFGKPIKIFQNDFHYYISENERLKVTLYDNSHGRGVYDTVK